LDVVLEDIKIISFNFAPCRSMPTSAALDVVAKHLNLKFFEVFLGTANFLLLSSCAVGLGALFFYSMPGTHWLEILW
jgi:phosphoglucomutase